MNRRSGKMNEQTTPGVRAFAFDSGGQALLVVNNRQLNSFKRPAQHESVGPQHKRLFFRELPCF